MEIIFGIVQEILTVKHTVCVEYFGAVLFSPQIYLSIKANSRDVELNHVKHIYMLKIVIRMAIFKLGQNVT